MSWLSKLLMGSIVFALVGCAATSQPVNFYTLQSISASPDNRLPAATRPLAIAVGPAVICSAHKSSPVPTVPGSASRIFNVGAAHSRRVY